MAGKHQLWFLYNFICVHLNQSSNHFQLWVPVGFISWYYCLPKQCSLWSTVADLGGGGAFFYTQPKGVGKATDTFRNKICIIEIINLILSIRTTSSVKQNVIVDTILYHGSMRESRSLNPSHSTIRMGIGSLTFLATASEIAIACCRESECEIVSTECGDSDTVAVGLRCLLPSCSFETSHTCGCAYVA